MRSYFNAEFFIGNRQRLRELSDEKLIVLTASGLTQRSGDSAFPFKQDASFWYLTGCNEPDIILVMDEHGEYLIIPVRDAARVTFEGEIDKAELARLSGIEEVLDEIDGWQRLALTIKKSKKVATLAAPPAYIEQIGLYTNPARSRLIGRAKEQNSRLKIVDIGMHLACLRSVKQPMELKTIQQAIDITTQTLSEVLKSPSYKYEYEIEAEITRGFRARGAAGHAFDPIVASGKHACALHYASNNGRLSKNDLIVLDVGAEVENYAADITRTVALKKPSKRQDSVYTAVLSVHQHACSLLKPGSILKEYEEEIERFMGGQLKNLGLIKVVNSENVRRYYPHATSHFLGLSTHDVGDRNQPLEPGMVLTVEPGIYIAEEHLGIRIEDDLLITENGAKILSAGLPRSLA